MPCWPSSNTMTGDCHEYFHATEDRQVVRDRVFLIIQSRLHHCQIYSLIVLKQVVPEVFWDEKRFYPEMLGQLLGLVISSSRWVGNGKLYIVTDSLPVTKNKKAVEKGIKLILSKVLPSSIPYVIVHHASKSNSDLQIADYINWAVFRKWERDDRRSYDIIKPAIHSETVYQAPDGRKKNDHPSYLFRRAP